MVQRPPNAGQAEIRPFLHAFTQPAYTLGTIIIREGVPALHVSLCGGKQGSKMPLFRAIGCSRKESNCGYEAKLVRHRKYSDAWLVENAGIRLGLKCAFLHEK